LAFDYRSEIIKEARRRATRLTQPSYIMGLTEAGGTDMITILPAEPKNMGLVVAPKKVVNHTLDKIRISASGFMAASVIAGGMYFYSKPTKNRDGGLGSE
ncbi:MAG: twin-arginine translocation pathway signal protein, partial [Deltaproteobacteria bacterium]